MTSGWFPPREDSPSVVSNRVFMVRRLNKMESQRLSTRLDGLNAEIQQAKSLIWQEQQELRKQLTQIREVKRDPTVSAERRKLLQQFSCKEPRRLDHGLSGETPGAQQRYRSLSTGDRYRGTLSTQLPLVNDGRSRSKSSCTPPRKEQLSTVFRKLSGGSNARINNSPSAGANGLLPSEAWPDISTFVTTNAKPRQRSVSTGTYPRISAWEGIGKIEGVTGLNRDHTVTSTSRFESENSGSNRGCSQDLLNLELRQSPTWVGAGTRKYIGNKNSATALTGVKINLEQKEGENMTSSQSSEFTSTRRERRQRSYSANSAKTISKGRVLEVCKKEPRKTSTVNTDQSVGSASSKQRRYSTNCRPKVVDGVVVDVPSAKKTSRDDNFQGVPVQLTRRERSLSNNCPPVVLEGENVESDDDKERNSSASRESEKGNTFGKHVTTDVDFHSKRSKSCQDISTVGTRDKTGQVQENGISLPRL